MIPAEFDYSAPQNLRDATRLLKKLGSSATILAGGHSLIPAMKLRLSRPGHVVDLRHLDELKSVARTAGQLRVGALTTHQQLADDKTVARACPLLQETAAAIGDIQVRNRGTIGGSVAHADPAADYPAALLALEATFKLNSVGKSRTVKAADFFVHLFTTAAAPGEILTEVRIPTGGRSGSAYEKLPHPASGFAIVGAAAFVRVRSGRFHEVRLALNGVAPAAYRAAAVEKALTGEAVRGRHLDKACELAAAGVEVMEDPHTTETYRRAMATVFAKRAIQRAVRAAG